MISFNPSYVGFFNKTAKEFSEKFEYCGKYKPDIKLFISKKI